MDVVESAFNINNCHRRDQLCVELDGLLGVRQRRAVHRRHSSADILLKLGLTGVEQTMTVSYVHVVDL